MQNLACSKSDQRSDQPSWRWFFICDLTLVSLSLTSDKSDGNLQKENAPMRKSFCKRFPNAHSVKNAPLKNWKWRCGSYTPGYISFVGYHISFGVGCLHSLLQLRGITSGFPLNFHWTRHGSQKPLRLKATCTERWSVGLRTGTKGGQQESPLPCSRLPCSTVRLARLPI